MRGSKSLWVAVIATACAVLMVPSGAQADGDPELTPTTYVSMFSEAGDPIGGGQSYLWNTTASDTVSVTGSVDDQVAIHVAGGSPASAFTLTFAAPRGQQLSYGTYFGAEKVADRDTGHAGMDITGMGRSCDSVTGSFDINDIGADLDDVALTYEMHCDGGPAVFGQVHINGDWGSDDPELFVGPSGVTWPQLAVGTAARVVPVTVWNTGDSPVTMTRILIDNGEGTSWDPDPSFSIVDNNCSTLAIGAKCVIDVGFTPNRAGDHAAVLDLTDTSYFRQQRVALRGTGTQGHTSWATHSETGDYVGHGEDRSFTPDNAVINATGDGTNVRYFVNPGTPSNWEADFAPPAGQRLTAGTTYEAATRYPFNAPTSPGLSVSGEGRDSEGWGRFTVQQATYDDNGKMLSFAATFELHDTGDAPALLGSVAWAAAAPASAVPGPDRTPPGPATGLSAGSSGVTSELSWTNPTDVDWKDTEVRMATGRVAPATPTDGTLLVRARTARAYYWSTDTTQDRSFSVFPMDYSGNPGPVASVTLEGSTVTGNATAERVVSGQDTTLQGRLRDSDTGAGVGRVRVSVYTHNPATKTYSRVASTTTRPNGSFTLAQKPHVNRLYTLVFPGSARRLSTSTKDVTVRVAPRISAKVDRAVGRRGSRHVITAHISSTSSHLVVLQRRSRGVWHSVATRRSSKTGSAFFSVRPRSTGRLTYRVFHPREPQHTAGWSHPLTVRTR